MQIKTFIIISLLQYDNTFCKAIKILTVKDLNLVHWEAEYIAQVCL